MLLVDRPTAVRRSYPLAFHPLKERKHAQAADDTQHDDEIDVDDVEEVLFALLKNSAIDGNDPDVMVDDVLLSEIAYDRWVQLFDSLKPPLPHSNEHSQSQNEKAKSRETMAALYWHMLQCLERNADMAAYLCRLYDDGSPYLYADWKGLVSRVERRIALLPSAYPSTHTTAKNGPRDAGSGLVRLLDHNHITVKNPGEKEKTVCLTPVDDKRNNARSGNNHNGKQGKKVDKGTNTETMVKEKHEATEYEKNQRSLDRISYLGGILLPWPIVAAVLSMGERFGPAGAEFFVFWAAAIPLSLIAVVIIYADTIRLQHVWVPTDPNNVDSAGGSRPDASEGKMKDDGDGCCPGFRGSCGAAWWTGLGAKRGKKEADDEEASPATDDNEADPDSNKHAYNEVADSAEGATGGLGFGGGDEIGEYEGDVRDTTNISTIRVTTSSHTGDPLVFHSDDEECEAHGAPRYILQRPEGAKPRAWKRQQLGWYGAVKSIVVRNSFRPAHDVPDGVPVYEI